MPRSIARRCAGVYSSSAVGSLGRMVITPPDTLISISCPLLKPARRRAAGETAIGCLFLMATVIVMVTGASLQNFHSYDSRYGERVTCGGGGAGRGRQEDRGGKIPESEKRIRLAAGGGGGGQYRIRMGRFRF